MATATVKKKPLGVPEGVGSRRRMETASTRPTVKPSNVPARAASGSEPWSSLVIAWREFRTSFDSPLAYVVICGSLVVVGLVFFMWNGGFWQADRASLTSLFVWLPRIFTFLIPVVTMRLLAEERRSGTLEMLITLPVRDHQIILGKFLGAWGLILTIVLSTVLFPILMFKGIWHLGSLDPGPVFTGYIGLILFSAAAVSIGLLVSALTESQVIAMFVTFFLLFALHWVDYFLLGVDNQLVNKIGSFLIFDARLQPFARGMIQTRDVVYFLSITIGCLMASFRALERRKWA